MTRYNEIMERVEVTPEMRGRVLANAAEAAANPAKRRGFWKPYVLAVACLALVLLGSLTLPRLLRSPTTATPTEDAAQLGGWEAAEYDSAEALSAAAGFAVRDVPALSAAAAEKRYILIGGDLAEIDYTVADAVFSYRVSPGSEDNSGVYEEYETLRQTGIGGVGAALKGDASACYLALWEADACSFSLFCDAGVPYADMEAYLVSALESGAADARP